MGSQLQCHCTCIFLGKEWALGMVWNSLGNAFFCTRWCPWVLCVSAKQGQLNSTEESEKLQHSLAQPLWKELPFLKTTVTICNLILTLCYHWCLPSTDSKRGKSLVLLSASTKPAWKTPITEKPAWLKHRNKYMYFLYPSVSKKPGCFAFFFGKEVSLLTVWVPWIPRATPTLCL